MAQIRGEMRILSLTMDAEHYDAGAILYAFGWARARLWEQYASNHAGVCWSSTAIGCKRRYGRRSTSRAAHTTAPSSTARAASMTALGGL
jgi:hypothetical protein